MAVFNNNLLAAAGAQGSTGFTINQSARYDQNVSAYLQNPNSNAGDSQKKFTFSTWFKRGALGENMYFFQYVYSYNADLNSLYFDTNDKLNWIDKSGSSTQMNLITNRVFRDPSAFYHIVVVWDTAQAVSSERAKIYINGVRETSFSTQTYPSLNADSGGAQRSGSNMRLAAQASSSGIGNYFDGYLAETHYSDNYAYESSNYGEFSNGIWIPKEVDISYGSAGFYFDYANASNLAANTKGKGNWIIGTDQGTGLAAHDQVTDTPTNNFPTFNPIYADVSGINSITVANGNLQGTGTSGQFDHKTATVNLPQSGKWYFEYYLGGLYTGFGICIVGQEASITGGYGFGALSTSQGFGYQNDSIYNGNAVTTAFGLGNRSAGDILNVAVDVDNNKFYLGINNTYIAADGGSDGNPSSGANPTVTTSFSLSTNDIILGFYLSSSSSSVYLNFGQEGTFAGNKTAGGNSDANGIGNFLYSVPTGFKALCTKNLGS